MCTLVMLHRPRHAWPMIVGANRDEMLNRAWLPPGRHWPDRPGVIAGLDCLAGGSWLGMNDSGVIAGIMNRHGTLGPEAGKRSRGELVLAALDQRDAASAVRALSERSSSAYRAFNLVVMDCDRAFWIRHGESGAGGPFPVEELAPGYSMFTERDRNDMDSARIRLNLPRFQAAAVPDPAAGDWSAWQALLVSREFSSEDGPHSAMWLAERNGFGTVCSSMLALPGAGRRGSAHWRFAEGGTKRLEFTDVEL